MGLHFKDWLFISVSFINILAAVGLTTYRLVVVVKENSDSSDFTFTVLLLINAGKTSSLVNVCKWMKVCNFKDIDVTGSSDKKCYAQYPCMVLFNQVRSDKCQTVLEYLFSVLCSIMYNLDFHR